MTGEQKFEKWYDKYERDGGELLLFNTIDLKSAYFAGREGMKSDCLEAVKNSDQRPGSTAVLKHKIVEAIKALE
jgi:hypothetical protein